MSNCDSTHFDLVIQDCQSCYFKGRMLGQLLDVVSRSLTLQNKALVPHQQTQSADTAIQPPLHECFQLFHGGFGQGFVAHCVPLFCLMVLVIAHALDVVPRSRLVALVTLVDFGARLTSHLGRNHLKVHHVMARRRLMALRAVLGGR